MSAVSWKPYSSARDWVLWFDSLSAGWQPRFMWAGPRSLSFHVAEHDGSFWLRHCVVEALGGEQLKLTPVSDVIRWRGKAMVRLTCARLSELESISLSRAAKSQAGRARLEQVCAVIAALRSRVSQ